MNSTRHVEKLGALLTVFLLILPLSQAQLLEQFFPGVSLTNIIITVVLLAMFAGMIYALMDHYGYSFTLSGFIQFIIDQLGIGFLIPGLFLVFGNFTGAFPDQFFWLGLAFLAFGLADLAVRWWTATGAALTLRFMGVAILVLWTVAVFFPSYYAQLPIILEDTADGVYQVMGSEVIDPMVCAGLSANARVSCTFQTAANPADYEFETEVKTCIQRQLNDTRCAGGPPPTPTLSDPLSLQFERFVTEGLPTEYRVGSRFSYPLPLDIDDRPIRRPIRDVFYVAAIGERKNFVDAMRIYTPEDQRDQVEPYYWGGVVRTAYENNTDRIQPNVSGALDRFRVEDSVSLRSIFGYENTTTEEAGVNETGVWGGINKLQVGKDPLHEVQQASYVFNSTAAFTDTSRFREGDYTIKIWDLAAWDDRTLEEHQDWERQECTQITTLGGGKVQRQVAAALTTPVSPSMYVGCGSFFFERVNESRANGRYHIPVTVSAIEQPEGLRATGGEPYFFEVLDVSSNCFPEGYDSPHDDDTAAERQELQELEGVYRQTLDNGKLVADRTELWIPTEDLSAEVTELTCSIQMRIRVGVQVEGTVSTPLPPTFEE